MSIIDHQYSILKHRLVACLFVFLCCVLSLSFAARSESTALRYGPSSTRAPAVVDESQALSASYPNCRYGSIPQINPITDYDTASINLGWYLTYPKSSPPRPNGILPVHLLVLKGRDCAHPNCPSPGYLAEARISPWGEEGEVLGQLVDDNPGSIWLVGNEPDRPYTMDDVLPAQYAQAYYRVYTLIKERDPSAQIGIGGIVQPTPLRLAYLDMILDEYSARYHHPMPVDIWNTHTYMVQEVRDSWGAEIPPGVDADTGVIYTPSQHGDPALFKQLLVDMRTWMKARGQQDKPLFITEFGILFPEWWNYGGEGSGWTSDRVIQYMYQTTDWLNTYTDPELGYPADNYRLVQRWNWWSLDEDSLLDPNDPTSHRWNGWLFESGSHQRSAFGDAFANQTGQITATQDLLAYRPRTNPVIPSITQPGETTTVTLGVEISNPGNSSVTQPFTVAFYAYTDTTPSLIATTTVTTPLGGCAGLATAEVEWPHVSAGPHSISVSIDIDEEVDESDETNNELVATVLIATELVYLPLVRK